MWNFVLLIILNLITLPLGVVVFSKDVVNDERDINRVALVIGNNDYQYVKPLNNAVNDSVLMSQEFKKLGFKVLHYTNLDLKSMKASIRELEKQIAGGGMGVLYFAGHGVQDGGNIGTG